MNYTLAVGALAALAFSLPVAAQDNQGPITLVAPAPPGGANDALARLIGAKLQELNGQPVIVQNKPGGNLVVGTDFVIKSRPDGRTLLVVGNSALTVNPVLDPKLPYDAQKDLVPVSRLAVLELILAVHPSVPANTVEEFIAYAKANPGKLNYGAGTPVFQLAMEKFKYLAGVQVTHIPYTGTARANFGVLANEVQAVIGEATSTVPHVKSGKLKALGAIPHLSGLPDVPPISKALPGYDMTVWLGLFAPRGTPAATVAKISADVARIVAMSDTREKMANMGMLPVGGAPDELVKIIQQELQSVRELAKTVSIQMN